MKFRDIFESNKSIDEIISEINKIKYNKEIWKKIQKMNKDNNRDLSPLSFFLDELIKLVRSSWIEKNFYRKQI